MLKNEDRVKLNVAKIKSSKDYHRRLDAYKDFVDNNAHTVFTVSTNDSEHGYKKLPRGDMQIVQLKEAPQWLWVSSDLIKT